MILSVDRIHFDQYMLILEYFIMNTWNLKKSNQSNPHSFYIIYLNRGWCIENIEVNEVAC